MGRGPAGPDNTVQLTELGRVFVRGLEAVGLAEPPESRVADVVLEPTDSLVYVHLTRVVANAGAGLLVDGYFKPEYVPWLVETTTLRRVLVSSRHAGAADDLKRMAVAVATVPNAATLEVRETNSMELHDRCLVRADGTVQLLGASVNGVGKNLTAVIAPDLAVMRVYRDRYENLWTPPLSWRPNILGLPLSPAQVRESVVWQGLHNLGQPQGCTSATTARPSQRGAA